VEIRKTEHTTVVGNGDQGPGGARDEYFICRVDDLKPVPADEFGHVKFQIGPIKETGVNGCQNEDLIAIVVDRLQCFQKGDFACRENEKALTKLQEALHWLNHRTADREQRGVEGTNEQ
jgi:hypothetical protein